MTVRPDRSFFQRDPVTLARALLGQRLVRVLEDGTRLAGIIVETEAYLGVEDLAAHTARGRRTARNESMWGDGGHAYVYFTYGMHHCMNIVAQTAGEPTAVLIRAIEPVEGMMRMGEHRGSVVKRERDLCSGPAKLCQALRIDRGLDGVDMVMSQELFVERVRSRMLAARLMGIGPRVGVGYAGEWAQKPLRFWVMGSEFASGK